MRNFELAAGHRAAIAGLTADIAGFQRFDPDLLNRLEFTGGSPIFGRKYSQGAGVVDI